MSDEKRELSKSQSEARQRLIELIRVGMIAGGAAINPLLAPAGELLFTVIRGPLEKHRDEVMEGILDRLDTLEEAGRLDWESLSQNDAFASVTLQAVQIAGQTREQEKRKYLRNAALNAALDESISETETAIFMDLLNRYTATHIACLKFSVPNENGLAISWIHNAHMRNAPANYHLPTRQDAYVMALPSLKENPELADLIHDRFVADKLVETGSIEDRDRMLIPDDQIRNLSLELNHLPVAQARCTTLGLRFLNFITDPTA